MTCITAIYSTCWPAHEVKKKPKSKVMMERATAPLAKYHYIVYTWQEKLNGQNGNNIITPLSCDTIGSENERRAAPPSGYSMTGWQLAIKVEKHIPSYTQYRRERQMLSYIESHSRNNKAALDRNIFIMKQSWHFFNRPYSTLQCHPRIELFEI